MSKLPHLNAFVDSDCLVLDGYAVIVQFFVGVLAISTLIIKRTFEWPQRPWIIWIFDASKQALSSASMHIVNVVAASLTGDSSHMTGVDQCVWYLTSLLVDGTLLLTIMLIAVYIWSFLADRFSVKTFRQGEYGDPPDWRIWIQQLLVYALILFGAKAICIWILYHHSSYYVATANFILSPVLKHKRLELLAVMIFIPLLTTIGQYWLLDTFLKANWQSLWSRRTSSGWLLVSNETLEPPSSPSSNVKNNRASIKNNNNDTGDPKLKNEQYTPQQDRDKQDLFKSHGFNHYILGSDRQFFTASDEEVS